MFHRPFFFRFLLASFCFLLLSGTSLRAQVGGSIGRIEFGPSFLNLTPLNQTLEAESYPAVRETIFALGLGFERFNRRWVYGGSLYNYMHAEARQDFQLGSMNYHYLTLSGGPVIYRQENRLLAYLTIGGGYGLSHLKVRPLGSQFHDNHFAYGALADVALNVRHFFAHTDDGNAFEIGLKAGYLYAPASNEWRIRSFGDVENGFSVRPTGPYLRLSLGMVAWK